MFAGIRKHGSSGKHLAEGERSLLSAFQESAQAYGDKAIGTLVPFFLFYNSIETFLDGSIRRVIDQAKENCKLEPQDIDVLKLLFMIKYVKEIQPKLENIATLMVTKIDQDKLALKDTIAKSLRRLVTETLIQKNGDEYTFLTDDEQDVNREIKNILVESGEVIAKIGEVIFEDIYQEKKFRYNSKYDFPFNQQIDDSPRGKQDAEMGLRVEQALEEIKRAIEKINKELTEANIYITSDHGFIYRRKPLEESDKTSKGDVHPLLTNKRFLIFEQAVELPGTINISLDYVFGNNCGLSVCVPRGDNRFKTPGGGQNYVHGGASLQEIVIPLIKYRNDRKKDDRQLVSKVDVRLTNTMRKLTNSIFALDFFQTEKLADKKVARTLKLYFVDAAGQRISNEQTILADRISEKAGDRTFKVNFNLRNSNYSKTEKYYLMMEDPEETVKKVYEKIPFYISLGIVNDFDF